MLLSLFVYLCVSSIFFQFGAFNALDARCFKDFSRKFQKCFKEVLRVFTESFKGVSRKFKGCFKEV